MTGGAADDPATSVTQSQGAGSLAFLGWTFVLFVALTAALTYPQMFRMGEAVNDAGDPLLNTWALSWVAHQLPYSPAHLFDGNIFYPERGTLAYSETLLAPAMAVAPLMWMGMRRIMAYNLVFVSGFVLSGVGTALLVRHLTRHAGAAILAGIIFAYLPIRLDHYAHLQMQQAEWIPLALWAFHRVMADGRLRDGLWLGVFLAGQVLSCTYYGVFLAGYLGVVGGTLMFLTVSVGRDRDDVTVVFRGIRKWLPALAVGVIVAIVLAAPAGRAYLSARQAVGERSAAENAAGSAEWQNFLASPESSALYGWSSDRFGAPERRVFPGLVAIALAVIALWPPWSGCRAAYGIGLIFAVDLTRGFNGLIYRFLYDVLTPLHALRVPARAGIMVGFSLAVLAGFGLARLCSWIGSRAARVTLVGLLCAAALAEYASRPLPLTTIPGGPPEIYWDLLRDRGDQPPTTIVRHLGDPPPAVIVELPFGREDPTYMYYSAFHWQMLLNGYSGFHPPSFFHLFDVLQHFPDDRSLQELDARGARYVVVHGELLTGGEYERLIRAIEAWPARFSLVARRPWQNREISLYRLR
jgi:hypothetical protein